MTTSGGRTRHVSRWFFALFAALAMALAAVVATDSAVAGKRAAAAQDRLPYQDPSRPVAERVRDLLSRMTLPEKVGQMGQINAWVLMGDPGNPWDRAPFNEAQLENVLVTNQIGSILSGGGAWPPAGNDARAWAEMTNTIQRYALENTRLGIPIIYGVDAVHGHNNLSNVTMFPHQIGLGATFDPALALRLGKLTARDVRATGIHWNFAPVLDTQRDHRWGRSYEPFSEDPLVNGVLGAANIRGQQGRSLARPDTVAATGKHFIGYSAPDTGMDRTDATISDEELYDIHLPPFAMGVEAGVATMMINSGSVNGIPGHANERLLTDVLRGELGFEGVAVSDWNDVEMLMTKYKVAATMEDAIALAVNAGMDMSMIPLDATGFTQGLISAVDNGKVSMSRIDQAVSRILTLKFRLGLFERPYVDAERANRIVEDPSNREVARRAARDSLVLLENDGTLPLSRRGAGRILVTGPASDSPTWQLGGWSLGWQGAFDLPGDVTIPAVTTLREGLQQAAGAGTEVVWRQGVPAGDTTNQWNPANEEPPHPSNDPANPETAAAIQEAVDAAQDADVIVVGVGESPYAEGRGDDATPRLPRSQAELVDRLVATGKPVVLLVMAGRPLVMNEQLDAANASLMAWWPGSEGGSAIADVLFGRSSPSGRLPVSWQRSVDQFPLAYNEPGAYDPRYALGHGLSYTTFQERKLVASPRVRRSQTVEAGVTIRNTGDRVSRHTVLAFVEGVSGDASALGRRLVAFDHVRVAPGDQARAELDFRAAQLAVAGAGGGRTVHAGTYRLVVGGESVTFTVRP